MDKKNNAGAVASNAGDDFHLIWACERLLDILKPNSKLKAISVEGPAWEDSIQIEDEKKLYSIDLAEYYGGNNFVQAQRVAFSQLKYSTFQMNKPWTASNLCAAVNDKKDNSIIRRLADTYNGFCSKYACVNQKLVLKLVSNRSLSSGLSKHLSECIVLLKEKKYRRTADLIKNIDAECKADIEKIYKTSKLGSSAFIEFLLILNFDDCGTNIRSIHKAEIIKQLGNWSANNIRSRYNDLIMHLRDMMLPEKSQGYPMDREYILAALGTTSYEVFPAPAKINEPFKDYIERAISEQIIDHIQENQKHIICLQATAGAGKTTLVSHLKSYLPEESVTVLYDCYGGGAFLQPSERRHLADVAIPQICNTLAVECGTDWLIGRPSKEYEWWRFLNERLEKAVHYVKEQNPLAVITIIIDAADNSIVAANTFKEDCFLHGLLNQPFPDGVYLIVTTRTERRYLIPFGDDVEIVNLPSFGLTESTLHIRSAFPDATDLECEEFHLLTDMNPRVQAYMLSSATSVEAILANIKPDGKTMESLFKEFIDAAKRQYSGIIDIAVLFSALINLPRPIPEKVLCEICNITYDVLKSISVECQLGFYISETFVFFKDEDFETYLRTRYEDNKIAISHIAEYMYNNRSNNSYCTRYLHIFLDKADFFNELVQISLNEKVDDSSIGVVQTNQVMQQRIQCVLKRAEMYNTKNRLLACKLIYKLIDFNAKDDALNELLFSAPNESVMYCDELSVYNVFHTDSNTFDTLGKAALVFSCLPVHQEDSRQYIKNYLAAINVFYNKAEEDRGYHSRPETVDIISIAEALLRLGEREKAIQWICGWSPRKAATKFVYQLFKKLLEYDYSELYEPLVAYKWASPNKLAIICAYITLGGIPPQEYVDDLLKLFERVAKIPESRFNKGQLVMFAEYLLQIQDGNELVSRLIDKFYIDIQFTSVPSLHNQPEQNELSVVLRYYALRHVCKGTPINSADFWKVRVASDSEHAPKSQSNDNKKSLLLMVDYLLPLYLFRLKCTQSGEKDELLRICNDILSKLEYSSWNYRSYDNHKLSEIGILVFMEAICLAPSLNSVEIKALVAKVLAVLNTSPQFKLELLNRLIHNQCAFQAALDVLGEIDITYEKYPASAREMSEVYLSCAKIGRQIEKQVGRKYFDKAIECTKGLDYESYRKVYLYKTLAETLSLVNIKSSCMSYKIIRLSEDFCRKMSDTKNFPYDEALLASTLLCERSIWGALCRLDDRNNYDGFSFQDTIPIVLSTLIESNCISIEKATSLIGLLLPDLSSRYNDIVDILLKKLSKMVPERQKPILEILINDALYNIPQDDKKCRSHDIVSYLNSVVVSSALDTRKIREMDIFLQQFETKSIDYQRENTEPCKVNIRQYLAESHITSSETLVERLKPLNTSEREGFVKDWLESLSPDKYLYALNWSFELLSNEYYQFGNIKTLHIIADFIESKKAWPQVEVWCNNKNNHKRFLHAFSRELLFLYQGYEEVFQTLLRIFRFDATTQYEVFLEHISDSVQCFDEQLVKALCRMSVALSTEDTNNLLEWCLDLEMSGVHPASGDAESYEPESLPTENMDWYVANFIWRILGHPDKGLCCKAAHVLLRLDSIGDVEILKHIAALYYKPLSSDYMNKDNYFFIDSAKLWYLATCLRIGKKNPETLRQLYSFFKSIACAEGIIHALHRRLARNICLQLAPFCAEEDIEILSVCDQCVNGSEKKVARYNREYSNEKQNWKFDFDTMDTLRYWYDDLAELFSCTQEEIATECDYFIAQFQITNKSAREWRNQYLLNEDYYKTSNDHGSIPSVETMGKYAEWHSMFYVADKFRQSRPQIIDDDIFYEKWLNKFLPGKDGFWCFEFRNHIPLISFLWDFTKLARRKPKREYIIPDNLAETMIEHNLGVSLNMEYHAHFEQSNQYIRIESAFVEKEDIEKLITELQKPYTALGYFNYDPEEYGYRNQSDFSVYPTCEVITTFPDYALDKKDLLLKDYLITSNYLMGVSNEFAKHLSVTKQEQILHSRVYNSTSFPVQTYHWSEPKNESGYEKHSTYGNLVTIEKKCLLNILQNRNQAIVFEVTISFEDDSYRFHGTPSKPAKKKYLYSLETNNKSKLILLRQLLSNDDV